MPSFYIYTLKSEYVYTNIANIIKSIFMGNLILWKSLEFWYETHITSYTLAWNSFFMFAKPHLRFQLLFYFPFVLKICGFYEILQKSSAKWLFTVHTRSLSVDIYQGSLSSSICVLVLHLVLSYTSYNMIKLTFILALNCKIECHGSQIKRSQVYKLFRKIVVLRNSFYEYIWRDNSYKQKGRVLPTKWIDVASCDNCKFDKTTSYQ